MPSYRYGLARSHNYQGIVLCRDLRKFKEAEQAHKQAIALCEKLIAELPDVMKYRVEIVRSLFALGRAMRAAGVPAKAEEPFRRAIAEIGRSKSPASFKYLPSANHRELIEILVLTGQTEKAEPVYQDLLRLNPKDTDSCINLAWLFANCPEPKFRNSKLAVAWARKAVDGKPLAGTAWQVLGMAEYRAGNWNESIAALNNSMKLRNGGDGYDWLFFSMAYWQTEDETQSQQWFRKATALLEQDKSSLNERDRKELTRLRLEAETLMDQESGIWSQESGDRKKPDF